MKLKALLAFALLLFLKLKNVAHGESVDKIPSSIAAESGIKLSWCLKQIKFALELEKMIGHQQHKIKSKCMEFIARMVQHSEENKKHKDIQPDSHERLDNEVSEIPPFLQKEPIKEKQFVTIQYKDPLSAIFKENKQHEDIQLDTNERLDNEVSEIPPFLQKETIKKKRFVTIQYNDPLSAIFKENKQHEDIQLDTYERLDNEVSEIPPFLQKETIKKKRFVTIQYNDPLSAIFKENKQHDNIQRDTYERLDNEVSEIPPFLQKEPIKKKRFVTIQYNDPLSAIFKENKQHDNIQRDTYERLDNEVSEIPPFLQKEPIKKKRFVTIQYNDPLIAIFKGHPEAKLDCWMKKTKLDVQDYYHMRVSRKNHYNTSQVGPKLMCKVHFQRPKPTVNENFFMRPL